MHRALFIFLLALPACGQPINSPADAQQVVDQLQQHGNNFITPLMNEPIGKKTTVACDSGSFVATVDHRVMKGGIATDFEWTLKFEACEITGHFFDGTVHYRNVVDASLTHARMHRALTARDLDYRFMFAGLLDVDLVFDMDSTAALLGDRALFVLDGTLTADGRIFELSGREIELAAAEFTTGK